MLCKCFSGTCFIESKKVPLEKISDLKFNIREKREVLANNISLVKSIGESCYIYLKTRTLGINAEEFILITRKTYAPDEKTAPQSQILHNPLINDKSFKLNYIQQFRQRNTSRDSPTPINPTSFILLTLNIVVTNLRKKMHLHLLI